MQDVQLSEATPLGFSAGGLGDWPAFGLRSDVRPAIAQAVQAGEAAALVTLYAAEGPAPHGLGAQMLFSGAGAAGFLSGGCIEGDVAIHAAEVLASGAPQRLIYGRGGPPDIRLLCGARIELLVERIAPDEAAVLRLLELGSVRAPALWLTDGTDHACLAPGEAPGGLPPALRLAFAQAVARREVSGPAFEADSLFRRHDPQPRVVVAGSDPTALAIASLAAQMGWATAIVRPKGPETPPPVMGARYLRAEPAEAFAQLALDPWTAVAATSHDLDADSAVLAAALPSAAGYVGVLGSRRRIPERIDRLKAAGLSEAAIGRLKAPIGLPIRAQTPWEIAASVLAEMVGVFKDAQAERAWPAAPAG